VTEAVTEPIGGPLTLRPTRFGDYIPPEDYEVMNHGRAIGRIYRPPVDAQKAIDSFQGTPASGRYFRSVLSRLISWGIPRGYRADNPVEHTEKIGKGGTYSPWPDWAFELFFEHTRIGLHLPVYTALYTGQRSVDVFKMRRPAAKE